MSSAGPVCSKVESAEFVEEVVLASWDELPDLVLTEIFSNLDRKDGLNASAVCKNWRSNYFQARFWPTVKFDLVESFLDKARFFIKTFGRTVKNAEVKLQSSNLNCLIEFINLLEQFEDNNNLKSLVLHSVLQSEDDHIPFPGLDKNIGYKIITQMKKYLPKLIEFGISCELEPMGCLMNELLNTLNPSVIYLSVVYFKRFLILPKITLDWAVLRRFQKLKVVMVDFSQLSVQLVGILNETVSLRQIIIFLNGEVCIYNVISFFLDAMAELQQKLNPSIECMWKNDVGRCVTCTLHAVRRIINSSYNEI